MADRKSIVIAAVIAVLALPAGAADNFQKCDDKLIADIYKIADADVRQGVPTKTIITEEIIAELLAKNIDVLNIDNRNPDNPDQCRKFLLSKMKTGGKTTLKTDDIDMNIEWKPSESGWEQRDGAFTGVDDYARAFFLPQNTRVMYACGDMSFALASVDAALWAATAVAVVGTFGSAGVAVAAVRTAATQVVSKKAPGLIIKAIPAALKSVFQVAVTRVGAKKTAEVAARSARDKAYTGAKTAHAKWQAAKQVVPVNATAIMQTGQAYAAAEKTYIQASNLWNVAHRELIRAETARRSLVIGLGTGAVAWGVMVDGKMTEASCGKFFSTINRAGDCYTNCESGWLGYGGGNIKNPKDDMNTKVFYPTFGVRVCVDEKTQMLYEITFDGKQGKPFVINVDHPKYVSDDAFMKKIRSISDKDGCDWHMNNQNFFLTEPVWKQDLTIDVNAKGFLVDGTRMDN
ncbi:MAG: hypothetical protein LBG89_00645 [Rickettsiales bacterium]|nr:hypothetical protein [Rickettsiales bacterium]